MNVWDEGPDSDKNLRYDSKKPGVVSGATFNKLVERMTSEKDHGVCGCVCVWVCVCVCGCVHAMHSGAGV